MTWMNLFKIDWLALVAGTLILLCFAAPSAVAQKASSPFDVTWIEGSCTHCRIAKSFGGIAFASGHDAWAFGYLPPGETGEGDGTMLRSVDGGRSWRELAWTYKHNGWPMASFSGAHDGWVAFPDPDEGGAELRFVGTRDGVTWRRLPLRDLFIYAIQKLGARGFAFSSDPYSHSAILYSTRDEGLHWGRTKLPPGFFADQMQFSDELQGYLAGCLDGRVVVLATGNGGGLGRGLPLRFHHPTERQQKAVPTTRTDWRCWTTARRSCSCPSMCLDPVTPEEKRQSGRPSTAVGRGARCTSRLRPRTATTSPRWLGPMLSQTQSWSFATAQNAARRSTA